MLGSGLLPTVARKGCKGLYPTLHRAWGAGGLQRPEAGGEDGRGREGLRAPGGGRALQSAPAPATTPGQGLPHTPPHVCSLPS